jgi:hypothetical protein
VGRKHITNQHGQEKKLNMCSRCKRDFKSAAELEAHATGDVVCEAKLPAASEDPEDKASESALAALSHRKNESSVKDWTKLWMTLFPMDAVDQIPSSGEWDEGWWGGRRILVLTYRRLRPGC